MMKFTNLGLNYANCTARCKPTAINGTVVRKNCSSIYDTSVFRLVASSWGGSRALGASKQLLEAPSPRRLGTRSIGTEAAVGNLYEILGVNPKATHKEIKAAYYNLSMTYHPDKNSNCDDAARKFREITSAYEVLGNFMNRKKYDRGIMTTFDDGPSKGRDDSDRPGSYESPRGKHYKSQVSVHMGHSTIYNFDEWTKEHYGETMAKTAFRRAKHQQQVQTNLDNEGTKNVEVLIAVVGLILVVFTYAATSRSYDVPQTSVRNSNEIKPMATVHK